MTSRLSKYPVPSTIRSSLVRNPPEAIPSLDELEQLHVELKALRQNSVDRAKKAGEDLRTIEESMQRMKAKEKGKARVHDKVKRERDCASTLPGCVLLIFIRLHISPGRPQPLYLINTFGVEFYIAMIDHRFVITTVNVVVKNVEQIRNATINCPCDIWPRIDPLNGYLGMNRHTRIRRRRYQIVVGI